MKIARLKNNEIMEIKQSSEEIIRHPESSKGNGWYNVTMFDFSSLGEYEQVTELKLVYKSLGDEVKEIATIEEISLDEYKIQKYKELSESTLEYVYSITPPYKQSTALGTIANPEDAPYTLEEANAIMNFANKHTIEVRRIKSLLFSATTFEEVDALPTEVKYEFE